MRNVFVDTNILIDLLADRPPFSKFAVAIFDLAENHKVKLFTSSHSYARTHYLLKKYMGKKELRVVLYFLAWILLILFQLIYLLLRKAFYQTIKIFKTPSKYLRQVPSKAYISL